MKGYLYLTLEQRREIERLHNAGVRTAEIAERLGKSKDTIYDDLKRGRTGERCEDKRMKYCAELAQKKFQDSIAQRGKRSVRKQNP